MHTLYNQLVLNQLFVESTNVFHNKVYFMWLSYKKIDFYEIFDWFVYFWSLVQI